ncbi:porin [Cupriavidus sp. SK-4]|uniref:porin n=1 Tax=Cupriavidus sp. SK-4 TaxID=574750 RepID=UPI00044D7D05|nr:porin [Cupriavidus sp. SK-4]EYS86887.1 porin [Cupriavidus sp. SK-4]
MKFKRYAIGTGLMAMGACAQAQGSIQLYGLLSGGVAYVSNAGGHPLVMADSGNLQSPRWGLRGKEDLGQGLQAIFQLESGFSLKTGALGQNGRLFGRQAYVGISSASAGTVTLGRQYDAVPQFLGRIETAGNEVSVGDIDNAFNSFRVQNAITYVTPDLGGMKAMVMYGASDKAGEIANNRAYSFGLDYERNGLKLALAHTTLDNPGSADNTGGAVVGDYGTMFKRSIETPSAGVRRQRVSAAGGMYTAGKAQIGALATDTRLNYADGSDLRIDNYHLNVNYQVVRNTYLGAAWLYASGKYSSGQAPKWQQFTLFVDQFLSKRTDIFLIGRYQRAMGDATTAAIFGYPTSAGRDQVVVTTGMRHRF